MEDKEKLIFKGKFMRIVILLNLDVLFFFLAAILYFILRTRIPYGTTLSIFFLILALVLGFFVIRIYSETRAWLDEHT